MFGDHPDVAASYNNIASIYDDQGKYEEALDLFTKSLDIRTRIYSGDNRPDVADSYSSIAVVNGRQGKYEEAFHLLEKSLDMRIKMVVFNHPDVLSSCVNLA